jgi:hypothetical protein
MPRYHTSCAILQYTTDRLLDNSFPADYQSTAPNMFQAFSTFMYQKVLPVFNILVLPEFLFSYSTESAYTYNMHFVELCILHSQLDPLNIHALFFHPLSHTLTFSCIQGEIRLLHHTVSAFSDGNDGKTRERDD